ncbi:MAG: hypothetical protein IJ766_11165 [Clostridia bacterium]|nr:hypothetical protein [Clostridia bacterium]MBR1812185.1 hypothetical protein [Clostridia bacterium]
MMSEDIYYDFNMIVSYDRFEYLTELTKKGKIQWICVKYEPITLIGNGDDLIDGDFVQSFTVQGKISEHVSVLLILTEYINALSGRGDMKIVSDVISAPINENCCLQVSISDSLDYVSYTAKDLCHAFAQDPIVRFADLIMSQIAVYSFTQKAWPTQTIDATLYYDNEDFVRIIIQLIREKRAFDFHRCVFQWEYRKKLKIK